MTKGEIIKSYRLKNNFTQQEIADKLGVTKQTLHKYENGIITNIPSDKIEELANIFDISPAYLMGWDKEKEDKVEIIGQIRTMNPYKYIPDPISAGSPENIDGQNYEDIYIPENVMGKYANNHNVIIMRVNGSSMNKIIPHDSLIGILKDYPACDLKNGDIVVFNDNHNYSVKRFFKTDNSIIFRPESTENCFIDRSYSLDSGVEIVGKVIMYSVLL